MSVPLAIAWLLFMALFPLTFFWLRRAWRILVRHDYEEVAVKHGEAPANAARFAPYTAAVNLAAGLVTTGVMVLVVAGALDFGTWTSVAGSTIWLKLIADFIISRHAHLTRKC